MKTYQSSTKERKKNFFQRHKYAIAIVASVIVIAAVVVLSVVFTLPDKKPTGTVVAPPDDSVNTKPTVMMPMTGAQVSMEYADDKLVKWDTLDLWQWHPAVDFVGEGDVVAVLDGTVTDVEKTTMDGNVVTVTHADGYVSVYKSLGSDIAVKKGDTVKAGDKLGVASNSMMSELNTGSHLHFELKKDGKHVDPSTLLPMNEDK